jgi:hypothetical protein
VKEGQREQRKGTRGGGIAGEGYEVLVKQRRYEEGLRKEWNDAVVLVKEVRWSKRKVRRCDFYFIKRLL